MDQPRVTTIDANALYQKLQNIQTSGGPSAASSQAQPQQPQAPQSPPVSQASYPAESAFIPGMYKPLPEEVLLEWTSPSRPFRKPNRRFFTTITIIGVLIGLILFFANQMLPVAVVIAVVFLAYVLFSIPPGDVKHQLTTYGIRVEEKLYYWEELGRFWFTKQYDSAILHIEVDQFPNTIHLLLGDIEQQYMKDILSEVLLYERPPLTPVEKAGKWLQEKVPLDLES